MPEQTPPQWTRETNWSQGCVLPPEAATRFGLSNAVDPEATCLVVVTHDCDLANDNLDAEPNVEVIAGRTVEAPNGNFTWAKAPRTIHYPVVRDGALVHIELTATGKQHISKSDLAPFEPDSRFHLEGSTLSVLRSWLGSRYNRAAFPDTFVRRMDSTKANSKLAKVLESHGTCISFVYFDLDEGQCIERGDGDAYQLSIVLVFHPGDDPEIAADKADEAADAVREAVGSRLADETHIVLKTCFAIWEGDVPVSKVRVLTQWRIEHMTLRADEEQFGPPHV